MRAPLYNYTALAAGVTCIRAVHAHAQATYMHTCIYQAANLVVFMHGHIHEMKFIMGDLN